MALNYLVICDDHNTYKHDWDDIYFLLLWLKSYIYSNLVEICWLLNNNVDFVSFKWHFYHRRLAPDFQHITWLFQGLFYSIGKWNKIPEKNLF